MNGIRILDNTFIGTLLTGAGIIGSILGLFAFSLVPKTAPIGTQIALALFGTAFFAGGIFAIKAGVDMLLEAAKEEDEGWI